MASYEVKGGGKLRDLRVERRDICRFGDSKRVTWFRQCKGLKKYKLKMGRRETPL